MKNVAIISDSDIQLSNDEFNYMSNQLINESPNRYIFYNYIKYTAISSHSHIRNIKLPFFFSDFFILYHILLNIDVLLIKGNRFSLIIPFIKMFTNIKVIVVINNIQNFDKSNKTVKTWNCNLKYKFAIRYSNAIITNSEFIQNTIFKTFDVLPQVIDNGGDHVERIESTQLDHKHFTFLKYFYAVSICDIIPENNLEIILDSFAKMKNVYLVLIGDWNTSNYAINLKNKYLQYSNIFLLNPVLNRRDLDLIRSNAIVYIHPEKFNNNSLLIEAMSLKMPIISFNTIENRIITEGKAFYYANNLDFYRTIFNFSIEKLRRNAIAMNEISERRFKWSHTVVKYYKIIDELLSENNFIKKIPEKKCINDKKLNVLLNSTNVKFKYQYFEDF